MPILGNIGDVQENLNDWNINPDPETLRFHSRQDKVYRSTVHFTGFIKRWAEKSSKIVDIGCGGGQATSYLASAYSDVLFLGLDISEKLILRANLLAKHNLGFMQGDVCKLSDDWHEIDGVVSLAMLSWMPDYKVPLDEIVRKIKPKWIAVSSLFYEGEISAKIEVTETKRPRRAWHNVYSIPRVREFMSERGYRMTYQPFRIDVELEKPSNPDFMKSYTDHDRIFSGPLYLPWGFLGFER